MKNEQTPRSKTLKLTQEADEWAAYGIQMLKLPGYAKYDGVNEE